MKKILIVILSLCLISFAPACVSLSRDKEKVSELRDKVFIAVSEEMKVTLITGVREEPFSPDGESGNKREFSVLTITPTQSMETALYTFQIKLGESVFEGEMNKHPLKKTWSYELDERIEQECVVTVTTDNFAQSFSLKSVIKEDFISPDEAYRIARKELSNPDGEIFVRLLENPLTPSAEGYYWYVAFVQSNYRIKAVLIHPQSKEVVARRD